MYLKNMNFIRDVTYYKVYKAACMLFLVKWKLITTTPIMLCSPGTIPTTFILNGPMWLAVCFTSVASSWKLSPDWRSRKRFERGARVFHSLQRASLTVSQTRRQDKTDGEKKSSHGSKKRQKTNRPNRSRSRSRFRSGSLTRSRIEKRTPPRRGDEATALQLNDPVHQASVRWASSFRNLSGELRRHGGMLCVYFTRAIVC